MARKKNQSIWNQHKEQPKLLLNKIQRRQVKHLGHTIRENRRTFEKHLIPTSNRVYANIEEDATEQRC